MPGPATPQRRARVARSAASFLVVLTGCSSSMRVADMAGGSLVLNLSPSAMVLFVDPIEQEKGRLKSGPCKKLSTKARATYNGLPLKRMTGVYANGDFAYDRDCLFQFTFPGAVDGAPGGPTSEQEGQIPAAARVGAAAAIQLEDESARWTLEVPDAFTPRRLTRIAPPVDQPLRRGDTVVLRWSPSSDVLDDENIGIGVRPGERLTEGVRIGADKVTVEGDRLTFVMPADLPESLNGAIQVQLLGTALVKPKTGPCPAKLCDVSLRYSAEAASGTLAP